MADKTKSTAPSLEQARIAQIFIRARDLERAIAFYRDVLGFKFLFQAPPQNECSSGQFRVKTLLGRFKASNQFFKAVEIDLNFFRR